MAGRLLRDDWRLNVAENGVAVGALEERDWRAAGVVGVADDCCCDWFVVLTESELGV